MYQLNVSTFWFCVRIIKNHGILEIKITQRFIFDNHGVVLQKVKTTNPFKGNCFEVNPQYSKRDKISRTSQWYYIFNKVLDEKYPQTIISEEFLKLT